MTGLSDDAVARLRAAAAWPELETDRYSVIEEIGRGGMGTVYRATDALLGRDVALKIPNGFGTGGVGRRLQLEAGVLARLEHPGIVPIHDAGRLADGRLFYVLKLVRGRTLHDYLGAVTSLSERLGVFERICDPVAFAHAHGFVHRDLKPDNIMLGAFGEVLVMDWGAAALTTEPLPAGGACADAPAPIARAADAEVRSGVVGTPGFMAPEQASAAAVDARADVYSLGAVLFLMLTGNPPGDGDEGAAAASRAHVPPPLRSICARAMARDPAQRYPDVADLAEDVRHYRAGLPVAAHRESLLERAVRVGRTYRTAILLVVAYLVMRMLVAVLAGR